MARCRSAAAWPATSSTRCAEIEARTAELETELATVRADLDKVTLANSHIAARLRAAEKALKEKEPPARRAPALSTSMGPRLIALDLALKGTPRAEAKRYLDENYDMPDSEALLEKVYADRA